MGGGSPSAFVVAIAATLLACLGLVHDGAQMLRAKTRTTTLAHEAARAGAQHLDADLLRTGTLALDRDEARSAARDHARLAGAGTGANAQAGTNAVADVDVVVSTDEVTVTVTTTYRPTVLAVLGEVEIASRATATAHTPTH
ncbi:pilus assembly protein TadG-related protein [Nocardiopsis dassonvillei]|uniref:pilus assembly protein TadG-related protein n=1 Tax=Nocardiopsis dassonvillei TaxID=2014 RepID=UPI00157C1F1B|nr:pilus assembly protein TadG-related protein [Nocardiopsis dassonvillei]